MLFRVVFFCRLLRTWALLLLLAGLSATHATAQEWPVHCQTLPAVWGQAGAADHLHSAPMNLTAHASSAQPLHACPLAGEHACCKLLSLPAASRVANWALLPARTLLRAPPLLALDRRATDIFKPPRTAG